MDTLFIAVMPAGLSYYDPTQEQYGDYKRIAFLDYHTLTLTWHGHCTPDMEKAIRADVAAMRARRGEQYEVSSCGQTVMLGE